MIGDLAQHPFQRELRIARRPNVKSRDLSSGSGCFCTLGNARLEGALPEERRDRDSREGWLLGQGSRELVERRDERRAVACRHSDDHRISDRHRRPLVRWIRHLGG